MSESLPVVLFRVRFKTTGDHIFFATARELKALCDGLPLNYVVPVEGETYPPDIIFNKEKN